ncbi:MAG: fasciclin domain-containing protein [Steroidobacteraceae bacterium]|jgi:uncharacterized surface protein with fasciclin (FAS1) repeats
MRNRVAATLALFLGAGAAAAVAGVIVGGGAMHAREDSAGDHSRCHSTLVAALKASGLLDALKGQGPFTLFAPDDGAFAGLPAGTLGRLMQPGGKEALNRMLRHHLVPGHWSAADLERLIDQGHGRAALETAGGGRVMLARSGSRNIIIRDATGVVARIDAGDARHGGGGIFSIDRVLR